MSICTPNRAALITLWLAAASAMALEETPEALAAVNNFRTYDATFASAGQPEREQFQAIRDAGFERVVYIAFSNSGQAIPEEDVIVKSLGMRYLHVPVDWERPLVTDFETFAGFMRQDPEARTLLHCQVNARASVFSFLYRVIYLDVPVADAKSDMNTVWQPNATWRDFLFTVLEANGHSPACDGCDWTPSESG